MLEVLVASYSDDLLVYLFVHVHGLNGVSGHENHVPCRPPTAVTATRTWDGQLSVIGATVTGVLHGEVWFNEVATGRW